MLYVPKLCRRVLSYSLAVALAFIPGERAEVSEGEIYGKDYLPRWGTEKERYVLKVKHCRQIGDCKSVDLTVDEKTWKESRFGEIIE